MYLFSKALEDPQLWLSSCHIEIESLLNKLRLQEEILNKNDEYEKLRSNYLTLKMLHTFFPQGNFENGIFLIDSPDKNGIHALIKNAREYVLLSEMCQLGKMQKRILPSGDFQFIEIPS